jgi:two-component system response regulator HydG
MPEKERCRILVVDDDPTHRFMLRSMLQEWGWDSVEADDGTTAVTAVQNQRFDAVLMDVRMTRMDGHEAFLIMQRTCPELPVVLMTAYSTVEDAVAVIQQGAHDYLTKPLDFDRLRLALERAADHRLVAQSRRHPPVTGGNPYPEIIGNSPALEELLEMISYVAPTEATVLISGESGTGKELIADALHRDSGRSEKPLVKVNCAALAEGLLESELFGHERGAFTGAEKRREGRFVQADGGTLFLDEIGETSLAMQVKLLRVLQEGELQRVGGEQSLRVDVRILAATNRDLEQEVKARRFREDLYYRLNVVMLNVPPLRDRQGDVEQLAWFFGRKFAQKNKRELRTITDSCLRALTHYPWPGNVRELQNAIERGIILMRGTALTEASLPLTIKGSLPENAAGIEVQATPLEEAEKLVIETTLEETGGNKSEAARRLGISRKTLHNKLAKYQL